MRFIHTSDVNLGFIPDPDMPWGKERAREIKDSFRKIIRKSQELSADCLLIAGDLFCHPPRSEELSIVNELFSEIPSVHVVIISGVQDRMEKNSILMNFKWSENVSWLTKDEPEVLYFDDINTEIHGISCYKSYEGHEKSLSKLDFEKLRPGKSEDKGFSRRIRILMLHIPIGEDQDLPFPLEKLSELQYDYIALGHSHNKKVLVNEKMAYSGSPEPLCEEDTGEHGIFTGDIHPLTHEMSSFSFIKISELSYIHLKASVNRQSDSSEIIRKLNSEIQTLGDKNIYSIIIEGKRDPEASYDYKNFGLSIKARISSWEDRTEPEYDFKALYREHPSDILGFFIRALRKDNEEEMSYVEKQALYYGIDALLQTKAKA